MMLHLSTDRLDLNVLFPEDAEKVARFYQRNIPFLADKEPNVSQAMTDVRTQEAAMNSEIEKLKNGSFVRYWYSLKENPEILCGTVCFQNITHSAFHTCQIGYKQDIGCMNRGYATEACLCAIRHLFNNESIHRITASVLTDNLPSVRLLKRLGFEYEGAEKSSVIIRGVWKDCYRYALIGPDNKTDPEAL